VLFPGTTVLEARQNIWLVDSKGLVTRGRGDSSTLEDYKLPYCHAGPNAPDLLTAVQTLRPTVLIGMDASGAPPFLFDQPTVTAMADNARHPLIFPLSGGSAEASASDVYHWTGGRAVVATDGPGEAVSVVSREFTPSQVTSTYIFPGVGEWGGC
jgi:malate dehydrogenase (oxaloacetate-decarboxylating)(NADP+)